MIVNCFIQARSNSSRLPGKIMMPINGVPLLVGLWDRLQACREISTTVILMPENDKFVPLLPKEMKVFTGPDADVARRFAAATDKYPCYGFVRVCADSPFLPWELVDIAALSVRVQPYTLVSGGRSGLQVEAFKTRDFVFAYTHMSVWEREHLGAYFQTRPSLAIDTQEDYDRLKDMPL